MASPCDDQSSGITDPLLRPYISTRGAPGQLGLSRLLTSGYSASRIGRQSLTLHSREWLIRIDNPPVNERDFGHLITELVAPSGFTEHSC